ncbi:MAG TPA: cupin domain-containing protein [Candidatus Krumholzibacteria bacterium]|nr:cupin domain-containing protein [Candidatus Krumholzibacteria bacterium]
MTEPPTLTEPTSLRGLLQYQEHAVVSRVLLKNKGGSVTVFAFDQGEALSEHTTPFDALLVVVEGEAEVDIDRTPHAVREGEAVLLPANRPHAVRAIRAFKMMLVMIKE